MKTLTSKQLERKKKKKNKMSALVAISNLNNMDRICKSQSMETENVAMDSDGPTRKKFRKEEEACVPEILPQSADDLSLNEAKIRIRRRCPKFRLRGAGILASFNQNPDDRVPIVLTDVQHMLLFSLLGELCPYQPSRWCHIERPSKISHTVALVVEGVSSHHYAKHEVALPNLKKVFQHIVEVITPCLYGGSLVEELAAVPLNEEERDSLVRKYGSIEAAMESRKDLMIMIRAVFPVNEPTATEIVNQIKDSNDNYPRTQLILSAWQLVEENYPLPLKGKLSKAYSDYVMTKEAYAPVTSKSPMFGLDCEMCLTAAGSELTRVSIVNEQHQLIYERLVLPYNRIFNYLTQYSGVTEEMLKGVKTRLEDVQREIRELLPKDAILVGQSLNSDLHALKMMHPYIIDTSVIFNMTGQRMRKSKLKILAKEFLKAEIQDKSSGHCSLEDSLTSLKLVQLKLMKSMDFGDAVLASRRKTEENHIRASQSQESNQPSQNVATTIFNHMTQKKKSSVVVGCEDIIADYYEYLNRIDDEKHSLSLGKKYKQKKVKLNTMDSQEEVVNKVCESAKDHNLTLAHLKMHVGEHIEEIVLQQLDEWVGAIWTNMARQGLLVLIMGGDKVHNGVSFVGIKSAS